MVKSESNIFKITEQDLLSKYSLVKPDKYEIFKNKDIVVIDKYGKTLTCAEITSASSLVRKHIDITNNPEVYRENKLK